MKKYRGKSSLIEAHNTSKTCTSCAKYDNDVQRIRSEGAGGLAVFLSSGKSTITHLNLSLNYIKVNSSGFKVEFLLFLPYVINKYSYVPRFYQSN